MSATLDSRVDAALRRALGKDGLDGFGRDRITVTTTPFRGVVQIKAEVKAAGCGLASSSVYAPEEAGEEQGHELRRLVKEVLRQLAFIEGGTPADEADWWED